MYVIDTLLMNQMLVLVCVAICSNQLSNTKLQRVRICLDDSDLFMWHSWLFL